MRMTGTTEDKKQRLPFIFCDCECGDYESLFPHDEPKVVDGNMSARNSDKGGSFNSTSQSSEMCGIGATFECEYSGAWRINQVFRHNGVQNHAFCESSLRLLPGDLVVEVEGCATAGLSAAELKKLVMGPEGSLVSLIVRRECKSRQGSTNAFGQLKDYSSAFRMPVYGTALPFKGRFTLSVNSRDQDGELLLQGAQAQVERRDKSQEDVETEGAANVFVAHFKDRIAGINQQIAVVQRNQQSNSDKIEACETAIPESNLQSELKKLQKRAESLRKELEKLKRKENALMSEKELIQKLLVKQIRLNEGSAGTAVKVEQSVDARKSGVLRSVAASQRNPLGDTILRLIPEDCRAYSSDKVVFPTSVRTKSDLSLPHKHCKVNFTSSCIARDDAINAVVTAANARNQHRVQQDRFSNPLIAVFAAPGGGKSFFVDILGERFRSGQQNDNASCLHGSVVLAITFNGVCSTPASVDQARNPSAGFALGVRVLWSYFVDCSTARTSDFERFYNFFMSAVPLLSLDLAVQCVKTHSGNNRVLLLVDELMKADEAQEGLAVSVLSGIGELLNTDAEFNAVVTSLQPSPIQNIQTKSCRPIVWISLPPFTAEESETALASVLNFPILEDPSLSELNRMVRLCISDVGGHPRGLEIVNNVLMNELVPSVDPEYLQQAVVRQFSKESPATPSMQALKLALKGRAVRLIQRVEGKSVEELIAIGVFLNSEVSINDKAEGIVPRISVMQVRSIKVFAPSDADLMVSLNTLILQKSANFEPEDLGVFHGNWEAMIRRLGVSGQMSLAQFYSRSQESTMRRPLAATQTMIDFSQKPDGLVRFDDARSIYKSTLGQNMDYFRSCKAVFLGLPRQAGFDSVTIERKAGGEGYIAIFVNHKFSDPSSKSRLQSWNGCLKFIDNPVFVELKISVDDCFLVMASWVGRSGNAIDLQKGQLQKKNSHIILLGREDLAELYTPSLTNRPHFIRRSKA